MRARGLLFTLMLTFGLACSCGSCSLYQAEVHDPAGNLLGEGEGRSAQSAIATACRQACAPEDEVCQIKCEHQEQSGFIVDVHSRPVRGIMRWFGRGMLKLGLRQLLGGGG